jgi:hypothetical protein
MRFVTRRDPDTFMCDVWDLKNPGEPVMSNLMRGPAGRIVVTLNKAEAAMSQTSQPVSHVERVAA